MSSTSFVWRCIKDLKPKYMYQNLSGVEVISLIFNKSPGKQPYSPHFQAEKLGILYIYYLGAKNI